MTDKEKLEKIKKIIDNGDKGWWDDTTIMCNEISDIIYETVPFNDIKESNKGKK